MAMTDPQNVEQAKQTLDYALASGALAAPVWVQYIQTYVGLLMALGGLALVCLRLVIAWQELQQKRKRGADGPD